MGLIIYNDKALWAVIPGVLAGLGMASFSGNATLSAMTGGAVSAVVDVLGRLKSGEASPAIVHPDAGGHVWFIPVWIIAGAVAVFAALARFGMV